MLRPLFPDMRKRIIEARLRSDTESRIAAGESASKSVVTRLWSQYRQTGCYAPRPNPSRRKPHLSPEQLEEVCQAIHRQPDIALWELTKTLHLPMSISALSVIVGIKLELLVKKTLHPVEQSREDVIEKRRDRKSEQSEMDINRIVFIDECGTHTGMTRIYGRGTGHERVAENTPDVRFERFTHLSSIRATGNMVPPVFEGALNGELSKEYTSRCPVSTLKVKDIVVMDSLISHKVKGVIAYNVLVVKGGDAFAVLV